LLTLIQGKIISLNEIIGSFLIILGVISVAIGLGNLSRWLKRIFKIKGLPI